MAIYATVLSSAVLVDRSSKIPTAYALKLDENILIGKTPIILRQNLIQKGQGDNGFIAGKVTEQGLPVIRRVACYHRMSGALIDTTWSDINGNYRFDNLVAGVKYFVTSLDENKDNTQYNAVTQDLITASEATL